MEQIATTIAWVSGTLAGVGILFIIGGGVLSITKWGNVYMPPVNERGFADAEVGNFFTEVWAFIKRAWAIATSNRPQRRFRRIGAWGTLCFLLGIVVLVISLVVLAAAPGDDGDEGEPTPSPTVSSAS